MRSLNDPMWQEPVQSGEADSPVQVRVMKESDLPAVVNIDRKHTQQDRGAFYAGKFAACVSDPGINTSLLAESDGNPVGFLFGQLFFGEFGIPATRAVLDAIGVRPDFSRHGVGEALMQQYLKNLEALRVEAVDTLVDWDRFSLLEFFRAEGFRPARVVDLVWDTAQYPFRARSHGVRVRPAEAADLPRVGEIARENGLPPQSQYLATKLGAALRQPADRLFAVAEQEGLLEGFVVGSLYHGEFGIAETRGVIDVFAVREAAQHRGVGSAIVEFLLARLDKLGIRRMETLCRWNHWPLLQFYEYVGFRPSARINLERRFGAAQA